MGSSILFGLPDSEREWDNYFIGDVRNQKEAAINRYCNDASTEPRNISFEEGDDKMCLIESIDSFAVKTFQKNNCWTESDDDLLKMLYGRECDDELISKVLKKTPFEVINRKQLLGLIP